MGLDQLRVRSRVGVGVRAMSRVGARARARARVRARVWARVRLRLQATVRDRVIGRAWTSGTMPAVHAPSWQRQPSSGRSRGGGLTQRGHRQSKPG